MKTSFIMALPLLGKIIITTTVLCSLFTLINLFFYQDLKSVFSFLFCFGCAVYNYIMWKYVIEINK